jgi:hypothetical protein
MYESARVGFFSWCDLRLVVCAEELIDSICSTRDNSAVGRTFSSSGLLKETVDDPGSHRKYLVVGNLYKSMGESRRGRLFSLPGRGRRFWEVNDLNVLVGLGPRYHRNYSSTIYHIIYLQPNPIVPFTFLPFI